MTTDTTWTPEMRERLDRAEQRVEQMTEQVRAILDDVRRIGMLAADRADKAGDPETAERVRAVVQS